MLNSTLLAHKFQFLIFQVQNTRLNMQLEKFSRRKIEKFLSLTRPLELYPIFFKSISNFVVFETAFSLL